MVNKAPWILDEWYGGEPRGFEHIRINPSEYLRYSKKELSDLDMLVPGISKVPCAFTCGVFSYAPACCTEIMSALRDYLRWDYVEVVFQSGARGFGVIEIALEQDDDDIVPGYKANLSEGDKISYLDLLEWIRIKRLYGPWSDWLRERVSDRVGRAF